MRQEATRSNLKLEQLFAKLTVITGNRIVKLSECVGVVYGDKNQTKIVRVYSVDTENQNKLETVEVNAGATVSNTAVCLYILQRPKVRVVLSSGRVDREVAVKLNQEELCERCLAGLPKNCEESSCIETFVAYLDEMWGEEYYKEEYPTDEDL